MERKSFASEAGESWARDLDAVDPLHYTVAVGVRRLTIRIEERLSEVLSASSFPVLGDFDVAALLGRNEPMRPSSIAKELRVTRAAISKRLERLENTDIVERRPDASDERAFLATLSRRGKHLTRRAVKEVAAVYSGLFEGMTYSEIESLDAGITKMIDSLREG